MIKITIVNKHGVMIVHEDRLKKSRLYWRGAGIEVYGKGGLHGICYEQAANLAMQYCQSVNIPVISLRKAN